LNQQQRIEFAIACRVRELLNQRQYDAWYRHEVCGQTFYEIELPTLRGDRRASVSMCHRLFNQAKIIMDCEYRLLFPERGGILSDPVPINVTVAHGSHAQTCEDVTAEAADWKCRISEFRKER